MVSYNRDVPDLSLPVLTDRDVLGRISCLVDKDAWRRRSLWLMFLSDDGLQLPVLVPVDDVPQHPDLGLASKLCGVIASLLEDAAPGGSAVITLARPGGITASDADRRWFHAIHFAAREQGVALRMMCLAAEHGVHQPAVAD